MSLDTDLAPATVLQAATDRPAPRRAFVDAHAGATSRLTGSWHLVRPRSGGQPRYAVVES